MQHQVEKLNAHEFVLLHFTFSIMKKILIPLYCITLSFLLFSCNDSEDLANKNFTEQFKDGFLESCSKQARLLMKKIRGGCLLSMFVGAIDDALGQR